MRLPGTVRLGALMAPLLLLGLAHPARAQINGETIDVLFLGNSYIYFNNLPRLVEAVSEGVDGPAIRAGSHTHGGFSLQSHLQDGHVPEVFERHGDASWDRVVLQEQSTLGTDYADRTSGKLGPPTAFHLAARQVVELVRASGADPVFYMTWAKEPFPNQASALARAYDDIGAELNADVAPVGMAWERVRRERPDVALFLPDGSHPDMAGSYLAACVLYAEMTGHSPIGAPSEIRGAPWNNAEIQGSEPVSILVSLEPELAEYLQHVAWETVRSHGP